MRTVARTDITAFPLLSRGKVRDIYGVDDETLLIVTTDRMSAFDVILDQPVPLKGVILNQLTLFWMSRFEDMVPNHVLESDVARFPEKLAPWRDDLAGRSVLARKAKPLPVECIVRGYLAGSAWSEYRKTGRVMGHELPAGLKEGSKLPAPIFTPSTKAGAGEHDENISMARCAALVGDETAREIRGLSLNLYEAGAALAAERGIIVADTKFEFGFINDSIHLIDEVLTPDSSRFWPESAWRPGTSQPSFDKQFLRDWLNGQNWNHEPPPPAIPGDILEATAERYRQAFTMLTGRSGI